MEFIEQIEEIANAKPTTENELEKANKLIQEERLNREKEFAKDLQFLFLRRSPSEGSQRPPDAVD